MRHKSEPGMLLDIASYARPGPADRLHLAQEEIQLLSRTVRRAPEVMVKVLTKGGGDRSALGRHLSYLSRDWNVVIETDDGRHLMGQGVEKELLEEWDLDLEEARRPTGLSSRPGRCGRSSYTRSCYPCRPGPLPRDYFRAPGSLRERHLGPSIAMPWCCTRTSRIRTSTWSSKR
jgi:hypothetical protein